MPVNRDDVKGGLNRTRKPAPQLSREDAKAAVHAYRATGALPSQVFADPIATLPVKNPAPLESSRPAGLYKVGPDGSSAPYKPAPPMGLDKAIGMVVGVRPSTVAKVVEHPLRFAEHNRKQFEASGYRSAGITPTSLIVASGLLGAPVTGSVAKVGARQGLETSLIGGSFKKTAKKEAAALPSVERIPIDSLRLSHPLDAPHHEANIKKIMGEMESGIEHPIILDDTGRVVDGNQRIEAARRLGRTHISAVRDVTDGQLPAGAKEVTDRLAGASRLRTQQEKLYSQERGKRITEAERLMNEIGGEEGHRLALQALKGDLPKLEFTAGKELSRDTLPDLFKHIQEHPDLRPYERVRTRQALLNVLDGKVPTKSEIKLLGTTFGEVDAQALAGSTGLWRTLARNGLDLLNVPRAITSSFDLSAPFRQGLVLGARHPAIFAREFKPMLKAFKSDSAYLDVMDNIATRPTFKAMQDAKLALTDLENMSSREESFMSNLAERIPVAGRGVKASGRAYVAFLNKFRADAFDHYMSMLPEDASPKAAADIARWINHATGRGSIKSLEGAMVPLNSLLFSPRLIASRLQLLNPGFYASLDPFARKQALRGMGQLVGAVSLTLYLAKAAGAQVGLDPRSADFGKIKINNTRIDIMGGFQQYLVLAARLVKGETVSSTNGQVEHLTGGFGKSSRGTLLSRFAQQKLAPVPGAAWGALNNENFAGQPWKPQHELPLLFAPLGIQNAVQTYRKNGPGPAAAGAVLGSIGFGVNTYGPKADADFKARMKVIDQAVKKGQLSPDRAAAAKRDLERVHYVQTHDTKQNRRQFLIDTMREQGYDNAEINKSLAQLHYDPVR